MTRKRQYGSGCLLKQRKGWAIRWRETEIAPDGTLRKALRYEQLGDVPRKEAAETLAQRLAVAATGLARRSRVTFRTIATEWESHVVPMYKPSTQKNHRHVLAKHLLPRFGDKEIAQVTRQEIQTYVAHLKRNEYSPRYIDHIHDVLSAVLRTAVKWGHLQENSSHSDRPLKAESPWLASRLRRPQPTAGFGVIGRVVSGPKWRFVNALPEPDFR